MTRKKFEAKQADYLAKLADAHLSGSEKLYAVLDLHLICMEYIRSLESHNAKLVIKHEAQIEELEEQVHGAYEQKAEAEGIIAMLNDGIKRLPEFIVNNFDNVSDLTSEVLEKYFSLCLETPESDRVHMKL